MNASRCVGRVGGLAVALGVGAAVVTGSGIAWAESPSSDPSGSAASGSEAGKASGSGSAKTPTGLSSGKHALRGSRSSGAPASTGQTTSAEPAPVVGTRKQGALTKLVGILGGHRSTATPRPQPASGEDASLSTSRTSTDAGAENSAQNIGSQGFAKLAGILGAHRSTASPRTQPAPQESTSESTSRTSSDDGTRDSAQNVGHTIGANATPSANWGPLSTRLTSLAPGPSSPSVTDTGAAATSVRTPGIALPRTARTAFMLPTLSTALGSAVTPSALVSKQLAKPSTATSTAGFSTTLATLVSRVMQSFAGSTPAAPPVDSPLTQLLLAAVRREPFGTVVKLVSPIVSPSTTTVSPTLVLNGYNVVPITPQNVTSFYGMTTHPPSTPGTIQGEQQFAVVDPESGERVGTFTALVSNKNSDEIGGTSQELLVTESSAVHPDTDTPDVPPVGSVISTYRVQGFGFLFSAMPSTHGEMTSFKILTPFADIPLDLPFNEGAAIAGHSYDNTPIQLDNGYYIAPSDPLGENYSAITGIPPFYVALQGDQEFGVYDSEGNQTGRFRGIFTPTSDILGFNTEAILVTENVTGEVGTDDGQTPPIGTVYNVIYANSNHDIYFLYSSVPTPAGDKISLKFVTPAGARALVETFDASAPVDIDELAVPGRYSFVPASSLQPTGINGLPPREVMIQGYQQFDVVDPAGTKIGSFDANVTTQKEKAGTTSVGVLVTKDTSGTAGATAGEVPPVGSTFNFVYFGDSGFGTVYSAIPSPSGDVVSYEFVTPVGNIPLFTTYNAGTGLTADKVTFPDFFGANLAAASGRDV
jgi:hypothetical protein